MTASPSAPAAMPSVEDVAHILMTHTGLQFATQADADRLRQRLESLFSSIQHEREAAIQLAEMNATAGAFWAKRGESAEARIATARALLVRAKDYIVYNADSLSMNSPATLLVEEIAAAIRSGEAPP